MTRRIMVNLIVFGILGVVMTVWALRNVITLDALARPYHIKAEFEASPGLQPNFDVAYLGVTVGKIRSVRLGDHKVVADLAINRGSQIPDNVTAAAGRQSAIGEPYVDLELPPGAAGGPPMRPGAVIPVSRTTVAVSYGDLFAAANRAVNGLNASDLQTLTHELAVGWDGRADSLQKILDGSEQITGTFAQNTELLNALIAQLTRTTGTLASHSGEFANGLDALTALTDALAQSNGQLARIRQTAPELLARFNQFLADTRNQNRCVLDSLGYSLPRILSQPALDSLSYTEHNSPRLAQVLKEVSPPGPNGLPNLNIDFVITLAQPQPALEYRTPLPLPGVGAIPSCAGIQVPAGSGSGAVAAAGRPGAGSGSTAGTPGQPPAGDLSAQNAASQKHGADPMRWLIYIPPLIALAVLIRMMGNAVPVLRRRRRNQGD